MIVLALDSTTPGGSMGLLLSGGKRDVRAGNPDRNWGERLPGDLLALLDTHGIRMAELASGCRMEEA